MKIIITGGSGLLGSALALDLAEEGHEVIVLSRRAVTPKSVHPGIRLVQWDGRTTQGWVNLVDGAEVIVNMAAPQIVTNRQFAKALGKVIHRPSVIPVPAFALRLLFGEMSVVILEGQNVSVERPLSSGFDFRFPEIELALRDLLSD